MQRRPTVALVAVFSYLPNCSQLVPHFLPVEVQNKDNNTPPAGLFAEYSHHQKVFGLDHGSQYSCLVKYVWMPDWAYSPYPGLHFVPQGFKDAAVPCLNATSLPSWYLFLKFCSIICQVHIGAYIFGFPQRWGTEIFNFTVSQVVLTTRKVRFIFSVSFLSYSFQP